MMIVSGSLIKMAREMLDKGMSPAAVIGELAKSNSYQISRAAVSFA